MSELRFMDLIIERENETITKITKAGVVIWPVEAHTITYDGHLPKVMDIHTANTTQIGGAHYQSADATGKCPKCSAPIQHWDWSHNLKGLEYAATKYIARWRDKGGLESLKKAVHYIQKIIEIHFPGVVVSVNIGTLPSEKQRTSEAYGTESAGKEAKGSTGLDASKSKNPACVGTEPWMKSSQIPCSCWACVWVRNQG